MGNAPDMPKLQKDEAPYSMHSASHQAPALYLFEAMNPGCPSVPLSLHRNPGTLQGCRARERVSGAMAMRWGSL
jgi:hypothetical protein